MSTQGLKGSYELIKLFPMKCKKRKKKKRGGATIPFKEGIKRSVNGKGKTNNVQLTQGHKRWGCNGKKKKG